MNVLRATENVSCAKMRGNSSGELLKYICPPPRDAMSLSKFASTSASVPMPMTLTVMPASRHFSSSARYWPGSSESAASAKRMMCFVSALAFITICDAAASAS